MTHNDCQRSASTRAIALDSIGKIKRELRLVGNVERHAFLLDNFVVAGRSAEFASAPLSVSDTFQQISAGSESGGHKSMKRNRVAENDGRDYQHTRDDDSRGQ